MICDELLRRYMDSASARAHARARSHARETWRRTSNCSPKRFESIKNLAGMDSTCNYELPIQCIRFIVSWQRECRRSRPNSIDNTAWTGQGAANRSCLGEQAQGRTLNQVAIRNLVNQPHPQQWVTCDGYDAQAGEGARARIRHA